MKELCQMDEIWQRVMPLEKWSTCKGISTSCISHFYLTINQMFRSGHVFNVIPAVYCKVWIFFGLSPMLYDKTNRDSVVLFPLKVVHWKINQLWQNGHVLLSHWYKLLTLTKTRKTFDEHSYVLTWNGRTTNILLRIYI